MKRRVDKIETVAEFFERVPVDYAAKHCVDIFFIDLASDHMNMLVAELCHRNRKHIASGDLFADNSSVFGRELRAVRPIYLVSVVFFRVM